MKRDLIQGFIDGYVALGGDMEKLSAVLDEWMKNHPVYPLDESKRTAVLSDLSSYRGVNK